MTLIKLLNKLFIMADKTKNNSVSVRALGGDSAEKRRLYERALEGAATDQKKIVDEYNKRFEYQG
jgi:hypothetical protein